MTTAQPEITTKVNLDPISGLVFRDARPFQAGEAFVARGIPFPPPPSAFWSAVKAATGVKKPILRGFALVEGSSQYYPAPLDLRIETEDSAKNNCRNRLTSAWRPVDASRWVAWKDPAKVRLTPQLFITGEDWVDGGGEANFLSDKQYSSYLTGDSIRENVKRAEDFFSTDKRTGAAMKGHLERRAADGRLYSEDVLFLNWEPGVLFRVGLANQAGGTPAPGRHIIRLGGEAKLASVECLSGDWDGGFGSRLRNAMRSTILGQNGVRMRMKLCLLTP